MNIGEVKKCAHCNSSGKCDCKGCRDAVNARRGVTVVCSACEGKGSVWVAPEIVQVPFIPNKS